jgi:hypothetical protein
MNNVLNCDNYIPSSQTYKYRAYDTTKYEIYNSAHFGPFLAILQCLQLLLSNGLNRMRLSHLHLTIVDGNRSNFRNAFLIILDDGQNPETQ